MRRTWPLALVFLTLAPALARPADAAPDPEPLPSGMEELGSASRDDLSRALAKVRRRYGDDAIVIETQLLVNTMRNGSLRATEVRVDGVRREEEKRYLVFTVETGLVFDTTTRDETTRVHMLWEAIVAPTLAHLTHGLRVPAGGVQLVMRYNHRPYRTQQQLRATLDDPGTAEETRFFVLAPDVDAVLARRETPHSLLARTRVTVNGSPRAMSVAPSDVPTAPGPD
jgi:hypothetical protein